MGILPLQFKDGASRKTLGLDGTELFSLKGLSALSPRMTMTLELTRANGKVENVELLCRIDTLDEIEYYNNGGILQYVLRDIA
jgi:aconitate hydratase